MSSPSASPARLRLGTRRSPLAMAQAEEVRTRLCAAHGWFADEVELVPVLASGDKVLDRPLAEIGGKALWTKELDQWLAEGRIDAAVHSAKDVETIRPDWLAFAAILPRADVCDVLIGAESLVALPVGARIGTSSPRRAAQALYLRPDCTVVPFRGNVQTRLARLEAGEADATLLAAAGLVRLGMSGVGTPLDPMEWLPAAAQGAIAVECRAEDGATHALLAPLDHRRSRAHVLAERGLLAALGGSCHSPVGVWCGGDANEIAMHVAIYSPDGVDRVALHDRFAADDLDGAARMAAELLRKAPPSIRQNFAG